MQKIRIDFDNPGLPQHISAVENDSQSRFFQATLYENGKAYSAPEGATYSIMYSGFGPQNQGWYDTINDGAGNRAACAVSGNVVTCEIARQALQVPGHVSIVLCVTTGKGYMLKSWPIECDCKNDRYDSTAEIQSFFYITQVSNADWNRAIQAVEELKNTIDPTLSLSGKAADAKATGDAVGAIKEELAKASLTIFEKASFSDVGKALTVKSVENGRVKEVKFEPFTIPTKENIDDSVSNYLSQNPPKSSNSVVWVKCEKLYNVIENNDFTFQGFALIDENIGCVAYYQSRSTNTHLRLFNMLDGTMIKDVDMGSYFHANPICVYNEKIYVANANSDGGIQVYSKNLDKITTITLAHPVVSCALFKDQSNNEWLVAEYAGTTAFFIYRIVENNLIPYKNFKVSYPRGGYNGLHASKEAMMYAESGYIAEGNYSNAIIMSDYYGNIFLRLMLNISNSVEIEDVSRVSGSEYLYVNDAEGNIYRIDNIKALLKAYEPSTTFWAVANNNTFNAYYAFNKVKEPYNGKNITKKFEINNPNNTKGISLVCGFSVITFQGDYYYAPCYVGVTGTITFNCTWRAPNVGTYIARIRYTTSDYVNYIFESIEGVVIATDGTMTQYDRDEIMPITNDIDFIGAFGFSFAKPWWIIQMNDPENL